MVLLRSGSDDSISSSRSDTGNCLWHKDSLAAYHEAWRRVYAKRHPMALLDPRFRVSKTNPSAPTLHFGLEVTKNNIMHCAYSRNLMPAALRKEETNPRRESKRFSVAISFVQDYIECTQGVRIYVQTPLSSDGTVIFSLYTNHTRRRLRRPQTEKLILNFIREELNMDQEQTAMWYWDIDHGLKYESEYAEFNV